MQTLLQDVRYAVRMLVKSPSFTIVAVVTLAITIGANAAIFSQVNAVFWKSLPVSNPEELRTLAWTSANSGFVGGNNALAGPILEVGQTFNSFSYPAYVTMRDEVDSFFDLACWLDPGENRPVVFENLGLGTVHFVSGNYFSTLGVPAKLGRTLTPDDDRRGVGSPVAVISSSFWQRAFGGDPHITEQTLNVNGTVFAIVGVLPQGFFGLDPAVTPDLMVPMNMVQIVSASINPLENTMVWSVCRVIGRLRPGISDEQARADAENWVHETIRTNPPSRPRRGLIEYEPPHIWILDAGQGLDTLKAATSTPLLILMAVVGGVLLIACANIAGLLLARGTARRREIATRLALGAPRIRLVRQLVSESLVLSALGGGVGIALAYVLAWLLPNLLGQFAPLGGVGLASDYLHRTMFGVQKVQGIDTSPDLRVLAFSGGLVLLAGLVFGLAPALRATRLDIISMIKQAGGGSAGRSIRFLSGKGMVTVQVALSILLLVGAGLLMRTVQNLKSAELGYEPNGLLYVRVEPRIGGLQNPLQRIDFFESALQRLENTPGIRSVSGAFYPPLGSIGAAMNACSPDFNPPDPAQVTRNHVGPGFFQTMQLPLLLGREFDWNDRERRPLVAIVNETFAETYFPDQNPVGQRFGFACPANPSSVTVVGVVADSKSVPRAESGPTMYLPFRQIPVGDPMTIIARSDGDPGAMAALIRNAVAEIDLNVPTFGEVSPTDLRDRQISRESTLTTLLMVLGAVALLLSCLGLYGLLAYTVNRRTSEIGMRMALGAQAGDVIRLIVRESLAPVGIGIVLGLVGALGLARGMASLLYGVSTNDPITIAGAAFLFLLIAAVAASIPARRAARIDPLRALRHE